MGDCLILKCSPPFISARCSQFFLLRFSPSPPCIPGSSVFSYELMISRLFELPGCQDIQVYPVLLFQPRGEEEGRRRDGGRGCGERDLAPRSPDWLSSRGRPSHVRDEIGTMYVDSIVHVRHTPRTWNGCRTSADLISALRHSPT